MGRLLGLTGILGAFAFLLGLNTLADGQAPRIRDPSSGKSLILKVSIPSLRVGTVKRLITPKRNQSVMSQTLHLPQA